MGRKRRSRKRAWNRLRASSVAVWVRRAWAIPAVRKGLVIAALYVVTLNAFVRYVGHGDAFLFSVFRLPEKTYAVSVFALHSLTHVWDAHDEDPRAIVAE